MYIYIYVYLLFIGKNYLPDYPDKCFENTLLICVHCTVYIYIYIYMHICVCVYVYFDMTLLIAVSLLLRKANNTGLEECENRKSVVICALYFSCLKEGKRQAKEDLKP